MAVSATKPKKTVEQLEQKIEDLEEELDELKGLLDYNDKVFWKVEDGIANLADQANWKQSENGFYIWCPYICVVEQDPTVYADKLFNLLHEE